MGTSNTIASNTTRSSMLPGSRQLWLCCFLTWNVCNGFVAFQNVFSCCSQTSTLCVTQSCTANCEVRCGFLGTTVCDPMACSVANPTQCITTAACEDGYTQVESKCYKVVAGPANYIAAITGCVAEGATLATIQSQAEQDGVYALTGDTGAWIGLADVLDEGTFSWVDGAAVSYTNWRPNQPNNGGGNQHCAWIRPDGGWDDVVCGKTNAYVCQKAITARNSAHSTSFNGMVSVI